MDWTHFLPPMVTTFSASLVECIEALTVVLAAGAVLGWRGALGGTVAALALLCATVAVLGPALTLVPNGIIHIVIGALLLVFGARWLRKAVLRAAGLKAMRDEEAAYHRETARLSGVENTPQQQQRAGFAAAFQICLIEGLEVIFIVIAVGAADRHALWPASLGALGALALVVAAGALLHRPVARIPENALKFGVGVLTCAFGIFWIGEGLGFAWPGGDWMLLVLAIVILVAALTAVRIAARGNTAAAQPR